MRSIFWLTCDSLGLLWNCSPIFASSSLSLLVSSWGLGAEAIWRVYLFLNSEYFLYCWRKTSLQFFTSSWLTWLMSWKRYGKGFDR